MEPQATNSVVSSSASRRTIQYAAAPPELLDRPLDRAMTWASDPIRTKSAAGDAEDMAQPATRVESAAAKPARKRSRGTYPGDFSSNLPHHYWHLAARLATRLNRDLNVRPERGEKLHEPPDREISRPVAHQRADRPLPCFASSFVRRIFVRRISDSLPLRCRSHPRPHTGAPRRGEPEIDSH